MNWLPGQAPGQRQKDMEAALLRRKGKTVAQSTIITTTGGAPPSESVPYTSYLVEMVYGSALTSLAAFTAHANRRTVEYRRTVGGELCWVGIHDQQQTVCLSMVVQAATPLTLSAPVIANDDTLYLYVDGALVDSRGTSGTLTAFDINLTPGEHRLQWLLNNGSNRTHLLIAPWFAAGLTWLRAATS